MGALISHNRDHEQDVIKMSNLCESLHCSLIWKKSNIETLEWEIKQLRRQLNETRRKLRQKNKQTNHLRLAVELSRHSLVLN